jgi:outer membrane lipoprotein carrier protein
MYYFVALFLAMLIPQQATPQDSGSIVDGVQRSFARMKDFRSDFVQVFQGSLNRKQQESGHLYLMRSRKMRWEYKNPEESYYISDGKTVYMYVPAEKQVNRAPVREVGDDRMPMMFLLGRSNLRDEFTKFATLNTKPLVPGTVVVQMYPKRKTDLTELIMEVDPTNYQVRRLLLAHSDGTRSDFFFTNIQTNTGLKASLFDFKVPPGVDVVEGFGQ